MPRVTYSEAQRREAVALARVIGADAASKSLGIGGKDTVRRWLADAGDAPALRGSADGWTKLLDVAQAKALADLVGGKLSAVQAATIAAISERNLRDIAKAESKPVETESWSTRFDRWCAERYADRHLRELARHVPAAVLHVALEATRNDPPDATQWVDETDAEHDERSFVWSCQAVELAGDLEAFDAEFRRWMAECRHRDDVVSQRAKVLHSSGMAYHAARAMAADLSADVAVALPAWAYAVDPFVGPPEAYTDRVDAPPKAEEAGDVAA